MLTNKLNLLLVYPHFVYPQVTSDTINIAVLYIAENINMLGLFGENPFDYNRTLPAVYKGAGIIRRRFSRVKMRSTPSIVTAHYSFLIDSFVLMKQFIFTKKIS